MLTPQKKAIKDSEKLGSMPIGKLLIKMSLPAIVGMLVMVLYNITDTIFVSKFVGKYAIGGMSIVMPITMVISVMGMTIGIGGGTLIAKYLGAQNIQKANKTFGNMVSLILITMIPATIIGYLYPDQVLKLFGAEGKLYPFARDYYMIVLGGSPILGVAMMLNNAVRSEGQSKAAMYTMFISAIINIVLDYIFILEFNWGIKGAAWATNIAQLVSALYLIWIYASKRSVIEIKPTDVKFCSSTTKEILTIGSSTFARQGSFSILAIIVNHALLHFGTEDDVAIYGILGRIFMFMIFPIFGIAQGFMPIASYNLGAKKPSRIISAFNLSTIFSTAVATFFFLLIYIFPVQVVRPFTNDQAFLNATIKALKTSSIVIPLVGLQIIGSAYFQSMGHVSRALLTTLSRQLFFLSPLIWIVPLLTSYKDIWYAFPIADCLSIVVTLIVLLPPYLRLKRLKQPDDHTKGKVVSRLG